MGFAICAGGKQIWKSGKQIRKTGFLVFFRGSGLENHPFRFLFAVSKFVFAEAGLEWSFLI